MDGCGFFVDGYYDFRYIVVLEVEGVVCIVFVDSCLFNEGYIYFGRLFFVLDIILVEFVGLVWDGSYFDIGF